MKKKILKIITVCSVAAVSVPFVSFAIPFSDRWQWPFVLDDFPAPVLFIPPPASEDMEARNAPVNEPNELYVQLDEGDRRQFNRGKAKRPARVPAAPKKTPQKDDVLVSASPAEMQLGLFDPRGYKHLSDYLNQFTDFQSGKLTTRGIFDGDLKKNLITETMNVFNDRAKKYHDQALPEGFIKFLTSKDGLLRLSKASNDHAIFDSRLASSIVYTNPRFKDFIRFQPEPAYAGRDTGSPPSVSGPGVSGRAPQPPAHIDTGGGLVSDVPNTGFTFLFPLELLIPQLKELSWNSLHPSLIYGNRESSSIGFIMNFAPKGRKPNHIYTVIFSELPNKNKKLNIFGFPRDILFYVAPVDQGRFVQDVVMHPVSLTQFLETLQNDRLVKLFSIEHQGHWRREVKIPYRAGSGNPISHVKWLD